MTSLKFKLSELIKNLKSDAVPRAPRPAHQEPTVESPENDENHNENVDSSSEQEEIIIEEADDIKKNKKQSKFKPFFKSNKKGEPFKRNKSKTEKSSVNTQAAGNVINVVGCNNVRWGNDYYMGPTHTGQNRGKESPQDDSEPEELIEKCNLITLVMEAKIKPKHEYIDHISKNLGKNWHRFFKKLGYTEGRIQTFVLDNASYGVSEARYKLLLDWANNEADGTLGRLSTLLWKQGERQIVKELALLYSKSTD